MYRKIDVCAYIHIYIHPFIYLGSCRATQPGNLIPVLAASYVKQFMASPWKMP